MADANRPSRALPAAPPLDAPPPMPHRGPDPSSPRRERIEIHLPASAILRVVLALVVIGIAVKLWLAFLLFLVAVVLAVALDPVVGRLERRGLRRDAGVLAVAIGSVAILVACVLLVVPPLSREIGDLVGDFAGTRARIERDFPADAPILRALVGQVLALPDSPDVRAWIDRPLVWGRFAVEVVSGGIVVLMSAMYLLVDGKRTYAWLLSYVPRSQRSRMAETVLAVTGVVRSYVRGQFITSLLCGAYSFVLLTALGVPAAMPLAIAASIFDVVPILGTVAITAATTLMALTVSPSVAAIVFAGYVLYHFVENYVIVPRVYGHGLRLSTLAVMLALVVGGLLQGVLGALLVLPLVAAYPIIERIWLRNYLGNDVVMDHTALAASVGTTQERAVEKKVIRGEEQVPVPPPAAEVPA